MALVVEDGTARANAESYAAVADANTYLANRGLTSWAALTDPAKEAALRRATDYMVQTYRLKWKGWRFTLTQALDWPRANVEIRDNFAGAMGFYFLDTNVIPTEVKNACIELAYRASTGELLADLAPQTLSETVGPISVTYAQGSDRTVKYQAIDRMLAPLLAQDGAIKVQRS